MIDGKQVLIPEAPPGTAVRPGGNAITPKRIKKLQQQPPGSLPAGTVVMYTDGSGPDNMTRTRRGTPKAGWGFVAVGGDVDASSDMYARELHADCGEVITLATAVRYIGAEAATNNTGELTAIIRALEYALTMPASTSIVVRFDSLYAGDIATGKARARSHKQLARRANELWCKLHAHCDGNLWCSHVKGHSGNQWNGRADELAEQGKRGGMGRGGSGRRRAAAT